MLLGKGEEEGGGIDAAKLADLGCLRTVEDGRLVDAADESVDGDSGASIGDGRSLLSAAGDVKDERDGTAVPALDVSTAAVDEVPSLAARS